MLKLAGHTLTFDFPEVHPNASLSITFERTCRIPDDGKNYPLPASLGHFPLKHIDDHRKRVPHEWDRRGGVMLPMYQSEAMWLRFTAKAIRGRVGTRVYPFAVKVAAGKQSAVTGKKWSNKLRKGDYMVVPPQQWLDGFVVEEGVIRQFVAMPLGLGATVEEQLTGEAEWGGLQIEVLPMKREVFDHRFPEASPVARIGSPRRRRSFGGASGQGISYSSSITQTNSFEFLRSERATVGAVMPAADMGLGAGGTMKQDIKKDPYDKSDWHKKCDGRRCYVHLANSLAWEAITKEKPPTAPLTAIDYQAKGLPWFDLYEDGLDAVKGKGALKGVKSVLEFGYQHGVPTLPENQSVKIKRVNMIPTEKGSGKDSVVREGAWSLDADL